MHSSTTSVPLAEQRLQVALDACRMGTWSYDFTTGQQIWDRRQYALMGVDPAVRPTRELFVSMVLPEDRHLVELGPDDIVPGVVHDAEFRIVQPGGAIRWLVSHSVTRADAAGRALELVGVNWDVTDRKTIETRLENSIEELELALDAGRMGTWRHDLITGRQVWNERQRRLLGLPADADASRSAFVSLVLPEDLPHTAFKDEDLAPGRFHESDFRIRRPDGQIRWLTARSFARHDANGRPIERIGVNWDITERKQIELAALEAERRLALATDAARLGIWDWNIETGAFFYSPRARQIYGFAPDVPLTFEILKQRMLPEDFARIDPILGRALDPGQRDEGTYRYRITRADTGEERWLLAHGSAVFETRNGLEQAVRFTGTLQDVTDEVSTQQALADEHARLELALDAADLAVWELDLKTNAVITTPELNRLFRFPEHSQPNFEDFQRLYAPGERERVQAEAEAAIAAGESSFRFEVKHAWPDGQVKWISIRARLFRDNQGVPARVLGVAMDVTERRLAEEWLRLTTRELQHRVKNTLSIVQSIASQSFRSAETKEEGVTAFLGRLRALATATDLLTGGNWTTVRVGEVVAEVLLPFRDAQHDRFEVSGNEVEIDGKNAAALALALHELSTNAVKYGALSTQAGRVAILWGREGETAFLDWQEKGGPPIAASPTWSGFGTRMLSRRLFNDGEGSITHEFRPEGVYCRISIRAPGKHVARSPEPGEPLSWPDASLARQGRSQ